MGLIIKSSLVVMYTALVMAATFYYLDFKNTIDVSLTNAEPVFDKQVLLSSENNENHNRSQIKNKKENIEITENINQLGVLKLKKNNLDKSKVVDTVPNMSLYVESSKQVLAKELNNNVISKSTNNLKITQVENIKVIIKVAEKDNSSKSKLVDTDEGMGTVVKNSKKPKVIQVDNKKVNVKITKNNNTNKIKLVDSNVNPVLNVKNKKVNTDKTKNISKVVMQTKKDNKDTLNKISNSEDVDKDKRALVKKQTLQAKLPEVESSDVFINTDDEEKDIENIIDQEQDSAVSLLGADEEILEDDDLNTIEEIELSSENKIITSKEDPISISNELDENSNDVKISQN